jgi:hypothetical protein
MCDALGSVSSTCNHTSGQCQCKENVEGRNCDLCLVSYKSRLLN